MSSTGPGNPHLLGNDRDAIKRKLAASSTREQPGTIAACAGVLLRLADGPAVGDLVVHPERATQSVSIGRITSDYRFAEPRLQQRDVTRLVRRRPHAHFSDHARKDLSARVAFFAGRDSADEFIALAAPRS